MKFSTIPSFYRASILPNWHAIDDNPKSVKRLSKIQKKIDKKNKKLMNLRNEIRKLEKQYEVECLG